MATTADIPSPSIAQRDTALAVFRFPLTILSSSKQCAENTARLVPCVLPPSLRMPCACCEIVEFMASANGTATIHATRHRNSALVYQLFVSLLGQVPPNNEVTIHVSTELFCTCALDVSHVISAMVLCLIHNTTDIAQARRLTRDTVALASEYLADLEVPQPPLRRAQQNKHANKRNAQQQQRHGSLTANIRAIDEALLVQLLGIVDTYVLAVQMDERAETRSIHTGLYYFTASARRDFDKTIMLDFTSLSLWRSMRCNTNSTQRPDRAFAELPAHEWDNCDVGNVVYNDTTKISLSLFDRIVRLLHLTPDDHDCYAYGTRKKQQPAARLLSQAKTPAFKQRHIELLNYMADHYEAPRKQVRKLDMKLRLLRECHQFVVVFNSDVAKFAVFALHTEDISHEPAHQPCAPNHTVMCCHIKESVR